MRRGFILVDGYNIIFSNKELTELAEQSLEIARRKLCDILCDYKGVIDDSVIAVFDAHLVEGGAGSVEAYNNIMVVFTKEAETADHYIERTAQKLARNERVIVATSDRLEQIIIIGRGAQQVSAQDFWTEVEYAREAARARYIHSRSIKKNPIEHFLDAETARRLDEMRYGR
ncbi:MAG: NYN domain-containing protein [Clostridiales bacterium]|jgi:predicted RNA-binding protein with PIN domain|nr:NYN domain-containing protein [Clostridiales bacterium]